MIKLVDWLMTRLVRMAGWLFEKIGLPDDDDYEEEEPADLD